MAAVPARTRTRAAIPAAKMAAGRRAVGPRTSGGLSCAVVTAGSVDVAMDLAPQRVPPLASVLGRDRDAGEVLLEDRLVRPVGDDGLQRRVDAVLDIRAVLGHRDPVVLAGVDRLDHLEVGPALHLLLGRGLVA